MVNGGKYSNEKDKKEESAFMKSKIYIPLLTLLLLSFITIVHAEERSSQFTVVYTNDIRGEIEPCG